MFKPDGDSFKGVVRRCSEADLRPRPGGMDADKGCVVILRGGGDLVMYTYEPSPLLLLLRREAPTDSYPASATPAAASAPTRRATSPTSTWCTPSGTRSSERIVVRPEEPLRENLVDGSMGAKVRRGWFVGRDAVAVIGSIDDAEALSAGSACTRAAATLSGLCAAFLPQITSSSAVTR